MNKEEITNIFSKIEKDITKQSAHTKSIIDSFGDIILKLEAEIDRLTEELEKAEAELKKYKAFWEWSRQADKMTFETYDYKRTKP